jgi:hypothetical protein
LRLIKPALIYNDSEIIIGLFPSEFSELKELGSANLSTSGVCDCFGGSDVLGIEKFGNH